MNKMTIAEFKKLVKKKPSHEEHDLQKQIVHYFDATRPNEKQRLIHINNKAKNSIEGAKFKSMGVRKGVADMMYLTKSGGVIWIELKKADGRQSKEQKEFQALCQTLGHTYVIVRDLPSFVQIINDNS